MPVISRFYGIVIRMYFLPKEHNPPHIHAIYGEDAAAFDIRTGKPIDGELAPRAMALIEEWIASHRSELLEIWQTQKFKKIPPLE